MKGGESVIDKLSRGHIETVDGVGKIKNKLAEMAENAYEGTLRLEAERRRNLDGASGHSSLYSTPIIKHGGKKNRRRKRKTRRRKRKTKRRTKRRRRTSKRRKRRR